MQTILLGTTLMSIVNKFCLLISLFVFAPLPLRGDSGDTSKPRFTRSECIVKVRFYWPENMPGEERERLIYRLFDEDKRAAVARQKPRIASMRFGTNDRTHLYLQYRTQCDRKREITEDYLGGKLIGQIPGFPQYEILDEVVVPHPSRIDSYGRWWLDGESNP